MNSKKKQSKASHEDSVIQYFRITADDGKTYDTQHYNLSAIIAKAKTACEVSGHSVENHFPDVRKMVKSNVVNPVEFNGIRNHSIIGPQP
ncbi:MAG: hypothetical protein WCP55_05875 [Lentisphaerota bacterium]